MIFFFFHLKIDYFRLWSITSEGIYAAEKMKDIDTSFKIDER